MTTRKQGEYGEKHENREVKKEIADAVRNRSVEGEITCADAFKIVEELNVTPDEVGYTTDILEVKLHKCQLGLYGYRPNKKIVEPAESVSEELERAIRQSLVNDRLTCAAAWEIAEKMGLKKMDVSCASEALKIKISPCQLGAF